MVSRTLMNVILTCYVIINQLVTQKWTHITSCRLHRMDDMNHSSNVVLYERLTLLKRYFRTSKNGNKGISRENCHLCWVLVVKETRKSWLNCFKVPVMFIIWKGLLYSTRVSTALSSIQSVTSMAI